MSENQVINGSNRVIEYPNRFKLNEVAGQANTYDLEAVTGEVMSVGTPYNKNILDKIDNVLSFLTPSANRVVTGSTQSSTYTAFSSTTLSRPDSVTPTFSTGNTGTNNITLNFPTYTIPSQYVNAGTYTPTASIRMKYGSTYKTFYSGSNNDDTYRSFRIRKTSSYDNPTSSNLPTYWGANLSKKQFGNGTGGLNDILEITYDFKQKAYFTLNYQIQSTSCVLQYSDNNTSWTKYADLTGDESIHNLSISSSSPHRYWRIQTTGTYNGEIIYIDVIYFNDLRIETISQNNTYRNEYTLDNNGTDFIKNQIIYIKHNTTTTNTTSNTLNGKNINTLLNPNTQYRLVYNGTQFLATTT